jgi:hypothetical protein
MIAQLASTFAAASMRGRIALAALACVLCVATPIAAAAEPDAAKRIRDELALMQQEQQAVFQQFQMVRELRNELLAPPPVQPPLSGYASGQAMPNYDDQVAAQRHRDERLADYGQEMERLYARYQELDARRKALVEELGRVGGSR